MVTAATFRKARYAWCESTRMQVSTFGGGQSVAVVALPHSNEPLGSAIVPCLPQLVRAAHRGVVFVDNVDPPPARHRFPLPIGFLGFLERSYLPRLEDQVEFSHGRRPRTRAQRRARGLVMYLRSFDLSAVLLVHNDPFASHPYLYGNRLDRNAENSLRSKAGPLFDMRELPRVPWTTKLSALTYKYWPIRNLRPKMTTQSAGLYLPNALRVPVMTLELPMFDWSGCPEATRRRTRLLCASAWWDYPSAGRRRAFVRRIRTECPDVPMVPARTNAVVEWSVIEAMLASRTRTSLVRRRRKPLKLPL